MFTSANEHKRGMILLSRLEKEEVLPDILFVVGMHRSATSAFTGATLLVGAATPQRLVEPDFFNPRGDFGSSAVIGANNAFLAEIGRHWHDFRALTLPSGDAYKAKVDQFGELLEHSFPKSAGGDSDVLRVIADPRLSLLAPLWAEAAERASLRPHFAVLHRNPAASATSIMSRDGLSAEHAVALWLRHTITVERSTRRLPRAIVSAERFVDDPVGSLQAAGTMLGIHWPVSPAQARERLEQLVENGLLKNVQTQLDTDLMDLAIRVHEALQANALSNDAPRAEATLDALALEFDALCPDIFDRSNLRLTEVAFERKWRGDTTRSNDASEISILATARDVALREREEAARTLEVALRERDEATRSRDVALRDRDEAKRMRDVALRERDEATSTRDIDIALLRRRPLKPWRDLMAYKALKFLSQASLGFPEKTRKRFARSAAKRNPDRSLLISTTGEEEAMALALPPSHGDILALDQDNETKGKEPSSDEPQLPYDVSKHRIEGRLARRPGRPTVMLCAHVAGRELFGSERSFLDMLNAMNALNFNVLITVPSAQNITYLKKMVEQAMAVYVIPCGWWRANTPINETVAAVFSSVIATESVDVVHTNTVMLREPLLAARRMGIRGIVHVRELIRYDQYLLGMIGETADAIIDAVWDNADLLIANSQATSAGFTRPGRTPEVVYNIVDMDALLALNPPGINAPMRVAMISSNIPKKGLGDFCEIACAIHNSHPDILFQLIGPENEHTARIEKTIETGALPPSIGILGYRNSPFEAIAEADVVLNLSSFQESFGRTALEAMVGARSVIVYDHGALPELLRDGETGFIVPVGDTAAVVARLRQLADDRALLVRMGAAARSDALHRFGSDSYVDQMRAAYDRVLSMEHEPLKMVLPARADLEPTPRAKLKVAYFLWHFPVPSETFVLNELRILCAKGIDVRVFCSQSPYPDFKPDFKIEFERVRDPDHLAERLKETGCSIVHSHFVFPTVTKMVMPACEKAHIPFTFIAHAQDIFRYRNDAENRVGEVSCSPWCRKVLVPSRFHFRYLAARGVPEEKMMLSANGCDESLYTDGRIDNRAARPFRRIVAIHRFTEKKGLIHLIRAGKLLANDGVQISLYGYGELEQKYRQVVAQEGITNVEFCGSVTSREAMLEIFREADLFACPSVRASDGDMDGIPTVLMEAMSAGLPVISSAISGIPDLVDDGITGLICEPTPEAIAARVREYYALPDAAVEAIIENALERIRQNYNSERLVEGMMRIWANETVDLMIVSWNNLPELTEVTRRLIANTSLPYHLVICDNGSSAATAAYLINFQAENDRVTLILNRENVFVGPGTNICLEHGSSDYAIYVCGKEGMTLRRGWELPLIHHMNAHPRVGQAGTLCYSPSYLKGRDYPVGLPLFDKFRNQHFAEHHSDRAFSHVQGGVFVLRRQMIDEIGAFSIEVPHNYTDVEFSYFVESSGWEIGEAPGLKSLFNKTRPGLFHRIDESVGVVHPPALADLVALDAIANGKVCHCNICAAQFPDFIVKGDDAICPRCSANRRARSLYRYLAESPLLFQRLPGLGIGLPTGLEEFWQAQFRGSLMTSEELLETLLGNSGRLDHNPAGLKVILLNGIFEGAITSDMVPLILAEVVRLLAPGGVCLVSGGGMDAAASASIDAAGLRLINCHRYASRVSHFDWYPIHILQNNLFVNVC